MEPAPLNRHHPLYGRNLRHAALVLLDRHGTASISEILEALWAHDFRLSGTRAEAGKRLADALRHEVRMGRAQRVARGRYAIRHLSRTTRYRIARRWRLAGPANYDTEGEPVLDGRSPDDRVGPTPWSRHDRSADHLWFARGRYRWAIGVAVHRAHLRGVRLARQPPPSAYSSDHRRADRAALRALLDEIPCGRFPNRRRFRLLALASGPEGPTGAHGQDWSNARLSTFSMAVSGSASTMRMASGSL